MDVFKKNIGVFGYWKKKGAKWATPELLCQELSIFRY